MTSIVSYLEYFSLYQNVKKTTYNFDESFRMMVHNKTHVELEQVSIDKGGDIIDHIWIKKTAGHDFTKL